MKNSVKKAGALMLTLMLICAMFIFNVSAAGTTSIAVSNSSPKVGSQVTVTVTVKTDESMMSVEGYIQYSSDKLEFVSGSGVNSAGTGVLHFASAVANKTTFSVSITFNAKAVGQSTVKVYNTKYVPSNFNEISVSDSSVTVNVTDTTNTTLSGNANLKALYLSNDIALTPAFNKDVTTYNVNVANSVTKVLVNAQTEDSGARWDVVGASTMKVGANTRTVVVTAPNGTQKKYVININRAAPDGTLPTTPETPDNPDNPETPTVNPYEVEINGEKWILSSEYPENIIPTGYVLSSTTVNGVELPALRNSVKGSILVYATSYDGSVNKYYLYNEITGIFSDYKTVTSGSAQYIILNFENSLVLPDGYYMATAELDGNTVDVIRYSNSVYANFVIVYAESESGVKGYYRIDTASGSVQLCPEFDILIKEQIADSTSTLVSRFNALSGMEKALVGGVALAIVIIIALIVMLIIRIVRQPGERTEYDYEDSDEFDDFDEDCSEELAELERSENEPVSKPEDIYSDTDNENNDFEE